MMIRFAIRMLRECRFRLLLKFAYTFGWKGMRAVEAFKKRLKNNQHFPAFIFFSVTSNCNLRCQGCWVSTDSKAKLSMDQMEKIILAGKENSSYFFGLLGGEPFLHPELFDVVERHPDCYFQVFTNGTLITPEVAGRMAELGNITPLISIEGLETVSDIRRGGNDVYKRTIDGVVNCRKAGLITGVATSVCQSNFKDIVSDQFLTTLTELGVHYMWYYIYRPVGPKPTPELSLNEDQILELRHFMVDARLRHPIGIVDAYWNHLGEALCPASTGISYHISPAGAVEPCPVVQFSDTNIDNGNDLTYLIQGSQFLSDFRQLTSRTTRGCILLDNPDELNKYLDSHPAVIDSSGRGTASEELTAMITRPGHHLPGKEIPEKNWMYRFAKKHWFFGFGAYG